MHELEMELDECKREVTKNRSLLLEREELVLRQEKELYRIKKDIKGKGKLRAQEQDEEQEAVTKRYKDAVEEKKALEALINGLRTHLTRLTSELASHQELLYELREFRAEDVQSMKQKGEEIKKLNDEVERLAGEVEVLRGVVEEGLRERRATREASMIVSEADVGMSRDEESEDERPNATERSYRAAEDSEEEQDQNQDHEEEEPEDEEEDLEDFESTRDADESRARLADRTLRTDHATLGSSRTMSTPTVPRASAPTPTRAATAPAYPRAASTPHRSRVQFVDQSELDEIQAEVDERRSNVSSRSNSPPSDFGGQSTPRRRDRQPTPRRERYADATRQVESLVEVDVDMTRMGVRTPSPDPRRSTSGARLDWWAGGNEDGERSPSPMPRKGGMAKLQQQLQQGKQKSAKPQSQQQQPVSERERSRNPAPPPSNASVQAQPASSMRVSSSSPRVHHQAPPPAMRNSPKPQAQAQRSEAPPVVAEAPFPQIRGERLEKLFFSAPEHNPETCTVCYRRRGREDVQRSLSYMPGRSQPASQRRRGATVHDEEDEDEGFEEGDHDHEVRVGGGWSSSAANPNVYSKAGQKKGAVPPQTVVMRVVRDLEDDFTHYKRFVLPPSWWRRIASLTVVCVL
jgi:Centrosome localisation domain of PPC89